MTTVERGVYQGRDVVGFISESYPSPTPQETRTIPLRSPSEFELNVFSFRMLLGGDEAECAIG